MTDSSGRGRTPAKPGLILKSLRLDRGWTLAEAGQRTGLPISTLSKVENGKMSLSYDKLMRICEAFEIDVSRLFASEEPPAEVAHGGRRSVTRSGDGSFIETANYGHLYPASDLLNKHFIPVIADLRARTLEEFGEFIRHPGEEYAYVLEGEVELHTELYAPVRLRVGDSIYFDSGMGHAYLAAGEGPCRVLSICSGPEGKIPPELKG